MKRILIVRMDNLGDILLGLPLLYRLKATYPNVLIDVVVQKRFTQLFSSCPLIDHVFGFTIPRGITDRIVCELRKTWKNVVGENVYYDVVCCPRWGPVYGLWSARIIESAWSNRKIGFGNHVQGMYLLSHLFHNPYNALIPELPGDIHESQWARQAAGYLRCVDVARDLDLWSDAQGEKEASNFISEINVPSNSKFIGLAIGAANSHRRWTADKWAGLIIKLLKSFPHHTLIIIGGGRIDKSRSLAMIRKIKDTSLLISAVDRLTLCGSAQLMRRMSLVIGVDSGPGHLASAVGTPTVIISCHPIGASPRHRNAPERFAPSRQSIIVRPRIAGALCKNGCVMRHPHCVLNVSLDEVIQAALTMTRASTNIPKP